MNTKLFLLPTLCLGGAAFLLAPREGGAFTKLGGNLGESQRDVRLFNNFADATANDNATQAAQFPGYDGAEAAIWKAIVEWGSGLHGDGSGDPLNSNTLGSGGGNFDAFWAGNTSGSGASNTNIVAATTTCGGSGTLAYCETPISDGWRIRFCETWVWDDGPGTVGSRWDIQSVMTHEYGHALGLGHSGTGQATMAPTGSPGQTVARSIHTDDINGTQCVYGVASATKPVIVATVPDGGGNITIYGSQFGATGNEIWFTPISVTSSSVTDPIVRIGGISSSNGGTVITLAIPAAAGPGDVIVNKSGTGNSTVSNAFPTDLVNTFGIPPIPHPNVTSITPSTIDALIPGTDETIQLGGVDLDLTLQVMLDGVAIDPSRWTIVNSTLITLDMPQASTLGAHDLGVTDGFVLDELPVTIVAPATPKYEMGTGDPFNVVDRDDGLPLILSGVPGRQHRVYASPSNLPSNNASFNLEIGNNFTQLFNGGQYVIPASGWLALTVPTSALPDPGAGSFIFYSQTAEILLPKPFDDSNVQSMTLVQ